MFEGAPQGLIGGLHLLLRSLLVAAPWNCWKGDDLCTLTTPSSRNRCFSKFPELRRQI